MGVCRIALGCIVAMAVGCTHQDGAPEPGGAEEKEGVMSVPQLVKPSGNMKLTSSAFEDGGSIPERYTLYGQNVTPALDWTGTPAETQSFAVLSTDPDAMRVAGREWVHWVVVDIPRDTTGMPEGAPKPPAGARQLRNDFGKESYGGPRPPSGTGVHHYAFKLYALRSKTLGLKSGASLGQIREAIRREALDEATLVGTFEKR